MTYKSKNLNFDGNIHNKIINHKKKIQFKAVTRKFWGYIFPEKYEYSIWTENHQGCPKYKV